MTLNIIKTFTSELGQEFMMIHTEPENGIRIESSSEEMGLIMVNGIVIRRPNA